MALPQEVRDGLLVKYMQCKSKKHDDIFVTKEDVKQIIENMDFWLDEMSPMLSDSTSGPFGVFAEQLSFTEMAEFLLMVQMARVQMMGGICGG